MNTRHTFGLSAVAAVLFFAGSSIAGAAEGASCAARIVGPQGSAGAVPGHFNAQGKCIAGGEVKVKAKDDGGGGLEASAQCKDLSFSYNPRRTSACAKHGGVLEWLAQQ